MGVKPISITGSKRLVRASIQYAIDNGRKTVTLVHKGNIQKFTEGAFRKWGYELATKEFRDQIITEFNKKIEETLGAIAANSINIYSGAMAFVTIGVKLPVHIARALVTVFFGVAGFAVAWWALPDAAASYEAFLLIIAY